MTWGFLALKNVDVYSFFGGGRVSQKVYDLYTHENVDIYGRPHSTEATPKVHDQLIVPYL